MSGVFDTSYIISRRARLFLAFPPPSSVAAFTPVRRRCRFPRACPPAYTESFVLVAVELAFSFAMGVSCLIFSLNLVRKLREEDQPPYHNGGGGSGGSHFTGPSVGLVRASQDNYSRLSGGEDGKEEGGREEEDDEEEEGNRGSISRPRTTGSAPPTTAAEFARSRGIGSLLSRNAGSRLDRYYDDDSDDGGWEATTAAGTTTMSNGRKPRADAGAWITGGAAERKSRRWFFVAGLL